MEPLNHGVQNPKDRGVQLENRECDGQCRDHLAQKALYVSIIRFFIEFFNISWLSTGPSAGVVASLMENTPKHTGAHRKINHSFEALLPIHTELAS